MADARAQTRIGPLGSGRGSLYIASQHDGGAMKPSTTHDIIVAIVAAILSVGTLVALTILFIQRVAVR